jgi:hypothetical protein
LAAFVGAARRLLKQIGAVRRMALLLVLAIGRLELPVEDTVDHEGDTALLRRRGYILTLTDVENGSVAWTNEDLKISIDCATTAVGPRWTARQAGELLVFAPTVVMLLDRLAPIERGLSVTDETMRGVLEVAERILRNKRALGPMSTGERIAAGFIFDKRSWFSDYSLLGAIERLGHGWLEAAMLVRAHLVEEGKIRGAPSFRPARKVTRAGAKEG